MSSPVWPTTWWRRRRTEGAPAPTGCLLLGDGLSASVGVAPKAALVDRARVSGIAVPDGFIVLDGVELRALTDTWADTDRRYAVRSAFGAEDSAESSLAGWFTSVLDVAPRDVPDAIAEVRRSADRRPGSFRTDVLVMEMVRAAHSGVAFSEPGTYDDIVNVTTGTADRLVSGDQPGERIELPRLERAEPGWPERLRGLLADVRDEFGDAPWDVEWADDGVRCWLVQIRPITAPIVRNETLTAANHAEILPRLPSQLMASLIDEAGPDLFGWYRQRVPGLPAEREFLHVVAGRPMINLSLLEDMMRHLGLPTTLVAESIGGGSGSEHPLAPARVLLRSPALLRLGLAQVTAVVRSRQHRERAAAIGVAPADSFTEALDDLHRAYVTLVTGMFPLSSAIGPPLAALRSAGTLLEHATRHRTITAEMAEARRRLVNARGPERQRRLTAFLDDFGHRGIYESDIARPRYRDAPATLVTDEAPGGEPTPVDVSDGVARRRTWRGLLTLPIWWAAAAPMRARELLRHDAMRSFANLRDALVALAEGAVERGALRSIDDLWLLDVDEARRLDTGWTPDAEFWQEREARRRELEALDVPHVVGRFDDITATDSESGDDQAALRGLPLTTGRVTGRAWVLDEPSLRLPDGFDRSTTVLVARSIDAGWISTIEEVAAVVVEIGGDLSHGSILIRELGTPAVTNVAGATRRLSTGDAVTVDAGAGTIRRSAHAPVDTVA